ncbi:MAG TPA: peptidase M11, partial [Candidatus Limnocylindria bacterium]|nr:peptidase M11 [Candidatus Limnocylindria bacterium]
SHSLDCGAAVIGGTCTSSDYGDTFDVMGSSSYHFNAFQKERLGWLDYNISPPITTVQSDGVYWIAPYQAHTIDPKALKVFKSADSSGRRTFYYLEARRAIGFDAGIANNSNVMNGVIVHMGTESSGNSSYLLDMTPNTNSWSDPALTTGQTFSDPAAGVTFTVLSADSSGAMVSVTFAAGGTASCVRANPSLTLTPVNQTVMAGGSVSHTVTVSNADSSACSASSFNLSSSMPAGLSGKFGASTMNLSPGSSSSTTLQVSAASSMSAGVYNFNLAATNGSASSYSKTASGSENVVSSLNVGVVTDKPSYNRNQQVVVTATVTAGGAPLANAAVTFTITKANGSTVNGKATTDASGKAVYKLRLNKQDPAGSYQAKAVGTMSNVSGTATANFTVQ